MSRLRKIITWVNIIKLCGLAGMAYCLWLSTFVVSQFWDEPTITKLHLTEWMSGVATGCIMVLLFWRLYALRSWACFTLLSMAVLFAVEHQTLPSTRSILESWPYLGAAGALAAALFTGKGRWKHSL